ncbi:MAG: 1,4-alpha-glucan branching protein GlgB [Gemmatimonadetes bacterium]|jgi:1,4-alpha-glucan branching enzyme|nr:1,4-alpha-glucan branching protein GlgB [Gemmatimonadota bacterium]MBT5055092.1 1,4-alpha-glucan branching protein GlgB [Gemmatimonadota bacterium]MBT5144122.1 1,4-alpha-glucan branching protein GlgB [Gemmatimonadota bacterium]MBT5586594.1 1,4-alpha-glucan branching protein GlgB [Gemmatimonadota bacterium]MBT5964430.1 1,4-alpha-glucan branching protein GlgB [Gemmatimonadota bacterium]
MNHVEALLQARHPDPFAYLGMHHDAEGLVARVFLPQVESVDLIGLGDDRIIPTVKIHEAGVFEARIEGQELFAYELCITHHDQTQVNCRDPYSFWSMVSSYDQGLFSAGVHHRIHEVLGAHVRDVAGVHGVHFCVWAPGAGGASVVGDFNQWDGRRHQMRSLGDSGLWEIFLPDLHPGTIYKYEIWTPEGEVLEKADPYAQACEIPPRTASIVVAADEFDWTDANWLDRRRSKQWLSEPIAIYELHVGSWRREDGEPLGWRRLADELARYIVDLGFTHVELMPIAAHPFDGSWGYQVTGYFAPASRFGSPEDFAYFIDVMHAHQIGVIVDWVPGHFPVDAHGLAGFDGTALYEHEDPRQGVHPDWGTLIFNFGRSEVKSFLLSNALFWLERFHVDGLRVDAVASMLYLDYSRKSGEWIPNRDGGRENLEAIDLLREMNILVYEHCPGVMTLAEESTSWPGVSHPTFSGGLGFGFKWNMGWMNDVLGFMAKEPVHRKFHHGDMTFGMLYAYHENFVLPLSHDEVVHGKGSLLGKMPGDEWQQFANLRLLYTYMYGFPGKKLLFMGAELGQRSEWDYAAQLDWALLEHEEHRGIQNLLRDLNHLYVSQSALHASDHEPSGFAWIDHQDVEASVLSFERRHHDQVLVFICNFTPVVRRGYRVGLPRPGTWAEVVNSDATDYAGSGVGNTGAVDTDDVASHGRRWSVVLDIPPLAALVLSPLAAES